MKLIVIFSIVLGFTFSAAAQTHVYQFGNSLVASNGIGPALSETLSCGATNGSYADQLLTTSSGTCGADPQRVFTFNEGGGLSYPNNSFIGGTYTIHIFFKFNVLAGGYQRIIDFKNSTVDRGMYILSTCLNFYPNGNAGTCPFFQPNTFYLISIVRDAATNLVNVYVNGSLFVTDYNDAAGDYAPTDNTTPVIFFRDDNAVTCEDKDGSIKYLSLAAAVSTPQEVQTVFNNICAIVLPLRLTSFTGSRLLNQNKTALQWSTENELNTASFNVERSIDGINFETIKNIAATSGSRNRYSYTDVIDATVPVYFYRLKMMDRDGKFTYSNIIRIANNNDHPLSVFPNPAKENISISNLQSKGWLQLYDAEGKLLQRQIVTSQSATMDIAKFPPGVYLLKYVLDGASWNEKIIKH